MSRPEPAAATPARRFFADVGPAGLLPLVVLVGLACKNAILIVQFAKQRQDAGLSRTEAAIEASRLRLRPILMTAMATMAGMLPLALALGSGSQMLQPLAIAVIGGITVSMVLSLIITPAVHFYLSHSEAPPGEVPPEVEPVRAAS